MRWAAIITFVVSMRVAHADECVITQPAFLPKSGTIVPLRPSIFVVLPPSLRGEMIRVSGANYEVAIVAHVDAYDIARVDLEPLVDAFEVRVGDRAARYSIGTTWDHAEIHEARDFGPWQVRLTLDGTAIALRVEWESGAQNIVPVDHGYARLGHIDCLGTNVGDALSKEKHVTMFAIFSDGSEQRLGAGSLLREYWRIHVVGFERDRPTGQKHEEPPPPPPPPPSPRQRSMYRFGVLMLPGR